MSESNKNNMTQIVLGQKYAYATVSLILGIACFVNLAGMEKAILAIIFGRMALAASPAPVLIDRRAWAKTGLVLGAALLVVVPTIILLNLHHLRALLEAFSRLADGK